MKTWTKIDMKTSTSLMGSCVLADGTIVLVGNAGLAAASRDDGASFSLAKDAKGRSFSQVIGSSAGDLIVVGEAGLTTLDRSLLEPK
jgi:photosystem II stability/assembly factor-like uncharacterized protein